MKRQVTNSPESAKYKTQCCGGRTSGRHRALLDVAARELRVRHRNARPSRGRDHAGALAEVAVVREQDEGGRDVRSDL